MTAKPPFETPAGDYAGDVTCAEAWDVITGDIDSVLIDVRTKVEWQLIGKADLSRINKQPIYLQWVTMQGINKNFIDELEAVLAENKVPQNAPIFFMCQSGGRSKLAAIQCTELGYQRCYNMADGFEGDLDEHQHRNSISGWKVAGLPWTQS